MRNKPKKSLTDEEFFYAAMNQLEPVVIRLTKLTKPFTEAHVFALTSALLQTANSHMFAAGFSPQKRSDLFTLYTKFPFEDGL